MARKRKQATETTEDTDTLTRIRTGTERGPAPKSPLGPEHLKALNQVIDACNETQCLCDTCMDAGIDIEPEMQVNKEQLAMAVKLKKAFFPNST